MMMPTQVEARPTFAKYGLEFAVAQVLLLSPDGNWPIRKVAEDDSTLEMLALLVQECLSPGQLGWRKGSD